MRTALAAHRSVIPTSPRVAPASPPHADARSRILYLTHDLTRHLRPFPYAQREDIDPLIHQLRETALGAYRGGDASRLFSHIAPTRRPIVDVAR